MKLCSICGKNEASYKQSYCYKCRKKKYYKDGKYKKVRNKKLNLNNRLCTKCGKPAKNNSWCYECKKEYQRNYEKKKYDMHKKGTELYDKKRQEFLEWYYKTTPNENRKNLIITKVNR